MASRDTPVGLAWVRPVVLVVDDEALVRSAVRRMLSREYGVLEAEDGVEALATLGRTFVDVVLSDYMMPRMNGERLLARVRDEHPAVRRVMLSGSPPEDVDRLLGEGVVEALLRKPCEPERLRALLARMAPPLRGDAVRAHPRVLVRVPVEARSDAWEGTRAWTSADLSRCGVFAETRDPPAVGTRLRLTLRAPAQPIAIEGRVAHVVSRERARALGLRAGIGVQFLDVGEDDRRAIDAWMEAAAHAGAHAPTWETPTPTREGARVPADDVPVMDRLLAAIGRLRELPYHVRLGVARGAGASDVHDAHAPRRAQFDERHFAQRSEPVRQAARDIRGLLDEARDALCDPARRRAYADTPALTASPDEGTPLPGLPDMWAAPAAEVVAKLEEIFARRPESRRCEALLETARARQHLEAGDAARGLLHLRRACEIDPRAREPALLARREASWRLRDARAPVGR